MKNIYALIICVCAGLNAFAQFGLDNTFGTNGIVTTNFTSNKDDEMKSLAVQSDGKIIAGGWTNSGANRDFALARYKTNGTLDSTFGTNGKVVQNLNKNDEIHAVLIQADGKIIGVGFAHNVNNIKQAAYFRFNSNGTADLNFGYNGMTTVAASNFDNWMNAAVLQSDGKIIAVGAMSTANGYQMICERITTTGGVDLTYNTTGWSVVGPATTNSEATSVLLMPNNQIVVCGTEKGTGNSNLRLVKLNNAGSVVNSFGTSGVSTASLSGFSLNANAICKSSNNDIIVAGHATDAAAKDWLMISKFDSAGALVNTFGSTANAGFSLIDANGNNGVLFAVQEQSDKRIVAAGVADVNSGAKMDVLVTRVLENGTLDNGFGTNGFEQISTISTHYDGASCMLLMPDGKLLIGGYANLWLTGAASNNTEDFMLMKYIPSNIPASTNEINADDIYVFPNPASQTINITGAQKMQSLQIIDCMGKIIASSNTNNIDVQHLSSGVYTMKIKTANGKYYFKNVSIVK
jgi:uncharacterized delta-60 repeat protein